MTGTAGRDMIKTVSLPLGPLVDENDTVILYTDGFLVL